MRLMRLCVDPPLVLYKKFYYTQYCTDRNQTPLGSSSRIETKHEIHNDSDVF